MTFSLFFCGIQFVCHIQCRNNWNHFKIIFFFSLHDVLFDDRKRHIWFRFSVWFYSEAICLLLDFLMSFTSYFLSYWKVVKVKRLTYQLQLKAYYRAVELLPQLRGRDAWSHASVSSTSLWNPMFLHLCAIELHCPSQCRRLNYC